MTKSISKKYRKFKERYGPLLITIVMIVGYWKFGRDAFEHMTVERWDVSAVYTGIFDLCAIIAAFIFGFFTFARTSETEFLDRIRGTRTYERFMWYLIEAICANSITVLLSLPFMVAVPKPTETSDPWFYFVLIWLAVSTYSLAATFRSVRQFIAIAMVEKQNDQS